MRCIAAHILPNLLRSTWRYGAALTLAVFFYCCSPRPVITSWKASNIQFGKSHSFKKILVTSMMQNTALTVRRQVEGYFADGLKRLGYNVVAASDAFGPGGLLRLHQEQIYKKTKRQRYQCCAHHRPY